MAFDSVGVLEEKILRKGRSRGQRSAHFNQAAGGRTKRDRQFQQRLVGGLARGQHLLHGFQGRAIGCQQRIRVTADPAGHCRHRQIGVRMPNPCRHGIEQRVARSRRRRMHLDGATRQHALHQSVAGFDGALIGIRPEIDAIGIRAARRAEQPGARELRPIIGAEQLHQGPAVGRKISGRNVPLGPWLGGIRIDLVIAHGRGTNAVPGHNHHKLQLLGARARNRYQRQCERDESCQVHCE